MNTLQKIWRSVGVLVYIAAHGRGGECEISEALDCNQATARRHLLALEAAGLIERLARFNGYTLSLLGEDWLTSNIKNTRMSAKNTRSILETDNEHQKSAHEREIFAHEREKSALVESLTTTTNTLINNNKAVVVEESANAKNARSNGKYSRSNAKNARSTDPRIIANINALEAAGISINDTTMLLAAQPHVSPEYISAIMAEVRADPNPRRRTNGLAIHRMQAKEQPTQVNPDDRSKYVNGQYSDWIEH